MVPNVILLIVAVAMLTVRAQRRLINGDTAHLGEFPYMVSINAHGEHFCGGSIISESFVLTAAHCFTESLINDPLPLSIIYGVVNRKNKRTNTDTMVRVKSVIIHEDYIPPPERYPNDIALLELMEKIMFGPNVKPVELPYQGYFPEDFVIVTLLGWGRTGFDLPLSLILLKAHFMLVIPEFCQYEYYPDLQLCGYFHKDTASCHGDSGGPLTFDGMQIGINSFGSEICATETPSVFTNVGQYRNWIRQNSGI